MKFANSWLKTESGGKVIKVGVFVQGRGRIIETVYHSRRKQPAKWVVVLARLIKGEWINQRDPDMQLATPLINKFLARVNENAGTEFQLATRLRPGQSYPEKGLIGG